MTPYLLFIPMLYVAMTGYRDNRYFFYCRHATFAVSTGKSFLNCDPLSRQSQHRGGSTVDRHVSGATTALVLTSCVRLSHSPG